MTKEQGEERAKEWKVHYMETSAKTKENVEEAFNYLLELIQSSKKTESTAGTKSKTNKKKKRKCTIL